MLGVFLDRNSVDLGDLDLTRLEESLSALRYYPTTDPHQVVERITDTDIVITNTVPLDRVALAAASHLKLICIAATGADHIDLKVATERGIAVCNVRGYCTPSVVQHVFVLILTLFTRLDEYRQAVKESRWQRANLASLLDHPIRELAGKTLGIVGYGELGQGVARMARAFDMQVLIAQRPDAVEPEEDHIPLHALLPQVDILSLHCPLTPETHGLIGEWELALMRRDAILINTARGGIVDEVALAEALRKGALGGAGVDVLSEEPPFHGNPLLAKDIPKLIVTPHCAWAGHESRQRLLDQLVENIHGFVTGKPIRVVV